MTKASKLLMLLLYHFKKCTKRRILDGGRREKQYYAVLRFSFLHYNSLESKSKQDSCVRPVAQDSFWQLELKVQDMNITTKSDCKIVLNQRANRILVCGLWQDIHFDSWTWNCRTWIITTKSDCKVVLNQRANRIHVCGLWQEIQFDIWTWKSRTWISSQSQIAM